MKKLVLFFAVIVAVSFASCTPKAEAPAEEPQEEAISNEVDTTNQAAVDAVPATEAAAPVAE